MNGRCGKTGKIVSFALIGLGALLLLCALPGWLLLALLGLALIGVGAWALRCW
nr:hypothetical protein [Maliibacterium massiliense]